MKVYLKENKICSFFSHFLLFSFVPLWHSETCLLTVQQVLGKDPRDMAHVQEKSQCHAWKTDIWCVQFRRAGSEYAHTVCFIVM